MTVLATRLLLFLLPFAVFLVWLWLMRRLRLGEGGLSPRGEAAIVYGGGAILAAILGTMIYLASREEPVDPRSLRYVPAQSEPDGKESPAHFEKKPDDGAS